MSLDYVIVGGGMSGLSAAFFCHQLGKRGVVLEARDRLGGSIDSRTDGEIYFELGAHSCFNSYSGLIDIINALPKHKLKIKQPKKYPFLFYQNSVAQPIAKKINKIEAFLSLLQLPFIKKNGKTNQIYYSQIFGKQNYKKILQYALSAVSSQNANDMPVDFLFKKRKRDKSYPRKYSFEGGLSAVINAIADRVIVKTGQSVDKIVRQNDLWQVKVGEQNYKAKKLILAVPPDICSILINNYDSVLAKSISQINVCVIDTVSMVINKCLDDIDRCAGWIASSENLHSMISMDSYVKNVSKRAFVFHFKAGRLDRNEKKKWILSRLGLDESNVCEMSYKTNILPKIDKDHSSKIIRIDRVLNQELAITGNYFRGMSIADCIDRSKLEANRIFLEK